MTRFTRFLFLLSLITLLGGCDLGSDNAVAESEDSEAAKEEEEKEKTIAELTEDSDRHDGLFTLYRDRNDGTLYLSVMPDQIDREYIYFAHTTNGVVEGGHFRGAYIGNSVFSLRRHFKRLEFVEENTSYYFDPDSALSRAADANISPAVLAVQEIVAEDEDSGEILVKLDEVLLKEKLQQVKPTPDPDAKPKDAFVLGTLSESNNKIVEVNNYPQNTAVTAEYVYENPAPIVEGEEDITNSRAVSIQVQHTFIEMPENDYQPRLDDYRIGYFTSEVTDLTTRSNTPYRDLIARWHLVKKDPDADLSDPVKPITWWIENTTPVEHRELIRKAALAWNPAFEKAGFSNAIAVEIQPDDAEWDAGDIRYNVLRWTSSPNPPFGGYGPSFTNPRTGQIIGADIMLEYSFLTNRLRRQRVLQELSGHHPLPAGDGNFAYCSMGHGLQLSNMYGMQALDSAGAGSELREQLIHDSMHYLILHEIGHTLGLNHNMKATQLQATPFDADNVAKSGIAGSVMDYPALNVAPQDEEQTLFYQTSPGPYDDWAIEYGYSTALEDAGEEQERVAEILARSVEPELAFGNDADDMRNPGKAIDPRVNIYDMSADAIAYAIRRLEQTDEMLASLPERHPESWQALHDGYLVMMAENARSNAVISRYIGGVYVDRTPADQLSDQAPFTPVSFADQKRAMAALETHLFAPDALAGSAELYTHLQQRRRGFDFWDETEDPKLHEWQLAVQKGVLDHLLHPAVLKRITDSRLYGNQYKLAAFMDDLSDAIFAADAHSDVNTVRQNLQLEYINRLAAMVDGDKKAAYDYPSQSMALFHLEQIRRSLAGKAQGNEETQAHTRHILFAIDKALDVSDG
ncbi:MAG: zinc-dependent metalloprotease [Gammaproteobacteria bacterium]|nr:zinc-dependent metalloprotease [Gammaproteobacteria bacterium]